MTTRGWKKASCKYGHVAPERNASGACVQCVKDKGHERYLADRKRRISVSNEYNKAHPEQRRDYMRACKFGVPVEVIRQLILRSDGKCESCAKPLLHSQTCIDHDHATNLIRGVLCRFCNALEGMLNKQMDRVSLLHLYLERHALRQAEAVAHV